MKRILIFSGKGSSLHFDREFSREKKEEEREDKRVMKGWELFLLLFG
jgi:hypothetical protein